MLPCDVLRELATLFLRLGITAFGGPAAHIAMMRDEVVHRHHWLTDTEFLDLLAATHLIPGPNSTELAIHLGYKRCGWPGLIAAGVCFILPACLIVMAIAWGYTRYGDTPQLEGVMYGIGPVIVTIILHAVWKLGQTAVTSALAAMIGVAAMSLSLAGVNELLILAAGALLALMVRVARRPPRPPRAGPSTAPTAAAVAVAGATSFTAVSAAALAMTSTAVPVTLTRLTLFFLKVGSVLFGSGYVLVAFLRADLTERWGWLTDQQLIDAITVGQVTPGPVFTTATFIGYLLGGWAGALLATAAIFLPGFVFVALTQPLIPTLRASPSASGLLDGIVAASLGLMAAVTWHVARSAVVDLWTVGFFVVTAAVVLRWQPQSTWLIVAGSIVGWIVHE